ncbi:glucose-1-phosphate adenylyltransferase small subunit, chloroplastic/amyloplastic-like [Ipomoea triloba]|uniref:glucose-1-phosphate adenylyltransferase small subunit, chloroplastic/amyloplastic-like n=1 Tax=Ipomoea triloba TaxID=35885 RepID=UPI00125E178D|nr:glucose-1-phosphate adenylyltransferase small subunit, chloroplastic/amyloplastic-like [Ipomoea triloba]
MLLKSTTTLPDEIEDKVENLDDDDNEVLKAVNKIYSRRRFIITDEDADDSSTIPGISMNPIIAIAQAKKRREVSGFDDEEEYDEENDEINVVAKALHKCGDSDFKPVLKPYQLVGINLLSLLYRKKIGGAILTVVALPMDEKRATAFGLMTIGVEGRIIEFVEKPKGELLIAMKVDITILGLDDKRAKEMPYILPPCIRSITVFVVVNLLRQKFPGANDFGSEVIPGATSIGLRVQAYLFDGYWEDTGTIEAFYNANLGITKEPVPDFNFYYRSAAIYTQPLYLPPKMLDVDVIDSVIGEDCVIRNFKIHHSMVGLRSCISKGAIIKDALLMGAYYYEPDAD